MYLLRTSNFGGLKDRCGGNELFNEWSRMTEQSLPVRLLNNQCYDLDPKTPFIYTSPLFGMGHGHYVFYEPKNVFQILDKLALGRVLRATSGRYHRDELAV